MKVHALRGCTPEPLAYYLKALGVLRLVAEQADEEARGYWKDESFHLVTKLSADELLEFFLTRYEPTPLVAPWNKGAGLLRADDPALRPVESSTAPRFERVRHGLRAGRDLVEEIAAADAAERAIKDETKRGSRTERERLRADPDYKRRLAQAHRAFVQAKKGLIPRCRTQWRGPEREWLDAALVLGDDLAPVFPALLGTGGNDGRLDFTNNYYQRLAELFVLDDPIGRAGPLSQGSFESALFGTAEVAVRSGIAVGQFLPGGAGGANATAGPEGDSRLNPADFVLLLEGAVLFRGHVTKRLDGRERAQATAPFSVPSRASGYASASASDQKPRGEQWMPLWSNPLTLGELRQLLAEGRARIGRTSVQDPIEFARAVARIGTARGIGAFQRFGYLERNGQSNLAVPLGRFVVPAATSPFANLVDDLDTWLVRLKRQAAAGNSLVDAEHRLGDAIFATLRTPDNPSRWQQLLLALAHTERVVASGSGLGAGPIPRLRADWLKAADDGSAETRLAATLALQHGRGPSRRLDRIRRHWLPLDPSQTRFETSDRSLSKKPDVVLFGRDGVADALALVERRVTECAQNGYRHIALSPAPGASARLSDLAMAVAGEVDFDRTLALARAFMAIDLRAWSSSPIPLRAGSDASTWPDDAWAAIRLAMLPWPLDAGRDIGNDPAIVRRLAAGDAESALQLAIRRLRVAGVHCPLTCAVADPQTARRWGAALAFPITRHTARRMARRIDSSFDNLELRP